MPLWRDPRVLSDDWTPPRLIGRETLLRELADLRPVPFHPHPRALLVLHGARGAGTSTLARSFGHDLFRAWSAGDRRSPPLWIRVNVAETHSPSRTILRAFQEIDPSVRIQGSSSEQLTLLFLRRLRTTQRPTILWFDQVGLAPGELGRILRPLVAPHEFMPEGADGLPLLAVLISGASDPLAEHPLPEAKEGDFRVLRRQVPPLAPPQLLEALTVRARLAFDRAPDAAVLEAARDLLTTNGWGLAGAGLVLEECARRAEQRGGTRVLSTDVHRPAHVRATYRAARMLDSCLLRALREGWERQGRPVPVGELMPRFRAICQQEGLPVPRPARVWRHLVVLEAQGTITRTLRMGGPGGTKSLLGFPALPACGPVPKGPGMGEASALPPSATTALEPTRTPEREAAPGMLPLPPAGELPTP
jgi:hypothetical protein